MTKLRSYMGKALDSDEVFGKDTTPAVGNMNVNAGGDIIDANGNVVKTRDQVAREYHTAHKKSVVSASILDDLDDDGYTIMPDLPKKAEKAEKQKPVEPKEGE